VEVEEEYTKIIQRTINERRMRKGPLKMRRQTAAFN
jgi:hypothetical protein